MSLAVLNYQKFKETCIFYNNNININVLILKLQNTLHD